MLAGLWFRESSCLYWWTENDGISQLVSQLQNNNTLKWDNLAEIYQIITCPLFPTQVFLILEKRAMKNLEPINKMGDKY